MFVCFHCAIVNQIGLLCSNCPKQCIWVCLGCNSKTSGKHHKRHKLRCAHYKTIIENEELYSKKKEVWLQHYHSTQLPVISIQPAIDITTQVQTKTVISRDGTIVTTTQTWSRPKQKRQLACSTNLDGKYWKRTKNMEKEMCLRQEMKQKLRVIYAELAEDYKKLSACFHHWQQEKESMTEELQTLENQLKEQEAQIEKLENKAEQITTETLKRNRIYNQIVNNSVQLIGNLPRMSPVRRPLLHSLTIGLQEAEIRNIYKQSKRSAIRIQQHNSNFLVKLKYQLNCTRKRVEPEEIERLKSITTEILPTQSGRDWRLQHCTDLHLFQQYQMKLQTTFPNTEPLSHSFVIAWLKGEYRRRFVSEPTFCPICGSAEELEQKNKRREN